MNKKILLLLLFLTILACSSKPEKTTPEKKSDGWWAGNPNNPSEKPFDYYYMRAAGRASEKAISKKSGAMMQKTCTDQAEVSAKGNLLGKIIGDTIPSRTYPSGQLYQPTPLNSLSKLYYPKYRKVYPQDKSNSFEIINLVTVTGNDNDWYTGNYYNSSKIIIEFKVKDCKPLAIADLKISYSEWKECECIAYAHIPGGIDAIKAEQKRLIENNTN